MKQSKELLIQPSSKSQSQYAMSGQDSKVGYHGRIVTNCAFKGRKLLIYRGLLDASEETNIFYKVGKTSGCQMIIDTGPGGRSSSQDLLLLIAEAVQRPDAVCN